jgi:gamma-glutamyl:cysteine ligase YbdK (ATP-grasp superfamily)
MDMKNKLKTLSAYYQVIHARQVQVDEMLGLGPFPDYFYLRFLDKNKMQCVSGV